jgi:tetratricopeptide (TPR) repeat protein
MWWRKEKNTGEPAMRLQEVVALQQRGRFAEAKDKLDDLVNVLRKAKDKPLLGKALSQLSQVCYHLGDRKRSVKCIAESAAIRTELQDYKGLAIDYQMMGTMLMAAEQMDQAYGFFKDSFGLATLIDDKTLIASSESNLGLVAWMRGSYSEAEMHFQRSQDIRKQQGDKLGLAKNLNHLGKLREATGRFEEAAALYQESLSLLRVLGAPEAAIALDNLNKLRGRK